MDKRYRPHRIAQRQVLEKMETVRLLPLLFSVQIPAETLIAGARPLVEVPQAIVLSAAALVAAALVVETRWEIPTRER